MSGSAGDDLGELAGSFPDVVESEIVRTAQIEIASRRMWASTPRDGAQVARVQQSARSAGR